MPAKLRKAIEILMTCHRCKWIGTVIECIEDEGLLRCPECAALVKQIKEVVVGSPLQKQAGTSSAE